MSRLMVASIGGFLGAVADTATRAVEAPTDLAAASMLGIVVALGLRLDRKVTALTARVEQLESNR